MKKSLFIFAAAALVLAGCNNDVTLDENQAPVDPTAPKEIAFKTISSPTRHAIKRAPVEGTDFPSGQDMYVAAFDATPGVAADLFGQTTFDEEGTSGKWKANPAKYWPIIETGTTTTLNFLAYTGVPSGNYFHAESNFAQSLTITLADNSSNQNDLMYAIGRGTRAAGVPATDVTMNFKHAQALIKFKVKSAADYGSELKLQSIVLTGAHYSGTYTIDNSANYNSTSSTYATTTGSWGNIGSQANVTRTPATADGWDVAGNGTVEETPHDVGAGILVVPDGDDTADDYTSFTINYTLNGKAYTYTHTPADKDVHQAKKYTFAITMTLNEIIIDPEVTDFVEEGTNVTIQ